MNRTADTAVRSTIYLEPELHQALRLKAVSDSRTDDHLHRWHDLPVFASHRRLPFMSTMNISLPESLKAFVDEQAAERGYGTSSEYVRELICREQDRQHLRGLLLAGAGSVPAGVADARYFEQLRAKASHQPARRAQMVRPG